MGPVPPQADIVAKRRDVLDALSTAKTKPTLVAELETSRSTIDRAIEGLLEHDLVERRGSEYVATYAGREAYRAYEQFLTRLDSLDAVQPVIRELPGDVDIPPAVFEGANVRQSLPEAPERPVEETLDTVLGSVTFRGTAPAILSRYLEVFDDLVESGTELELVLTEAVRDSLTELYPDGAAALKSNDDITCLVTGESLPYAVWVADRPDGQVSGLIVYSDTGLVGIVSNDTDAMNEWATAEYERIRRDATPLD